MSNLNWPEGATHYLEAGDENTRFRDLTDDTWKYFNMATGKWVQHSFCSEELLQRRDLISRPQPKPWSGPEDGLPPVGLSVMVHECSHDYTNKFNGQTVRIVGHDRGDLAVFAAKDFIYHALIAEKFKLPPTTEQLAAEEREKGIREMIEVCKETAQSDNFRLTPETVAAFTVRNFGRLYDAGFKR